MIGPFDFAFVPGSAVIFDSRLNLKEIRDFVNSRMTDTSLFVKNFKIVGMIGQTIYILQDENTGMRVCVQV